MSNIMIIGDCHLKATSPISRLDNYPTAILNKLLYLAGVAKNGNCHAMLLLGDVFDSPVTSLPYLAEVINVFKKISEYDITVYTIVGNHDIKNNRMDSLPGTALGILISTGYVKLAPRDLAIDSTIFRCFHYPEPVEKALTDECYQVCVAHLYYEFNLANDSLHEDDVKQLNYDAMILGHYHVPCDTETIGNTLLYRPGSLSRSTSEPYNKLRTPRALIFNCINHKAIYLEAACSPAEEVFVQQTEDTQQIFSMKDLIQFITTSYSSSDMNVREYFSSLEIPYACREKIAKYLDDIGA